MQSSTTVNKYLKFDIKDTNLLYSFLQLVNPIGFFGLSLAEAIGHVQHSSDVDNHRDFTIFEKESHKQTKRVKNTESREIRNQKFLEDLRRVD